MRERECERVCVRTRVCVRECVCVRVCDSEYVCGRARARVRVSVIRMERDCSIIEDTSIPGERAYTQLNMSTSLLHVCSIRKPGYYRQNPQWASVQTEPETNHHASSFNVSTFIVRIFASCKIVQYNTVQCMFHTSTHTGF